MKSEGGSHGGSQSKSVEITSYFRLHDSYVFVGYLSFIEITLCSLLPFTIKHGGFLGHTQRQTQGTFSRVNNRSSLRYDAILH